MRNPAYWDRQHPQFPTYQRLVKRAFQILYPGDAKYDATGRMIDSPPLAPHIVAKQVDAVNFEMAAMDGAPPSETGSDKTHDGMVHVESHTRDGGKTEVSDYWRNAPGHGAGESTTGDGADKGDPENQDEPAQDTLPGQPGEDDLAEAKSKSADPDNKEFLDRISKAERSYDKLNDGYGERNPVSNELGRYQMKPGTLDGIGWRNPDGSWTEKAAAYGVTSDAEFLRNSAAQEAAAEDMFRQYEKEARGEGLYRRIGAKIDGVKAEIEVTDAGIMAAVHAEGATGTRLYFDKIEKAGYRSKDLELTRSEKRIETRLREFRDVPYGRMSKR